MALTAVKQYHTIVGNVRMGCYKITGDASGTTTWSAPIMAVTAAWYQRGTDTATDEKLTWSGNTVTWSTAIASGTYGYLNYVGI